MKKRLRLLTVLFAASFAACGTESPKEQLNEDLCGVGFETSCENGVCTCLAPDDGIDSQNVVRSALSTQYPPNGEVVLTSFPVTPDGIYIAGVGRQHIAEARFVASTIPHTIRTITLEVLDQYARPVTPATNPIQKIEIAYWNAQGVYETNKSYVDEYGRATFLWRSVPVPTSASGYVKVNFYAYPFADIVGADGQLVSTSGMKMNFRPRVDGFLAEGEGSTITVLRTDRKVSRQFTDREGKPFISAPSYTYRTLVNGTNELYCDTISSKVSAKKLAVMMAEREFFFVNPNGLGIFSLAYERSSDMAIVGQTIVSGQNVLVRVDPAMLLDTNSPTRYCLTAAVSGVRLGNSITTYPKTFVWSDGVAANIPQWGIPLYNAQSWQKLYAR